MSATQPPSGPPQHPPFGGPSGPPPSSPPPGYGSAYPSSGPASGSGEVLDSSYGSQFPPPPSAPPGYGPGQPPKRRGLRRGLIAGGVLVGLAAVGTGAVFAWQSFNSDGAQPAEALPASTLGYVSINLDPSAKQKIEALKTLNKFPAFKDKVNIGSGDDLRQKLFDEVQKSDACPGLDYDADIKPWIGDRFAIAAVPLAEKDDNGNPKVAPVGVVEVTDADKAEAAFKKLQACGDSSDSADSADSGSTDSGTSSDSSSGSDGGWAIENGWAIVAESDQVAQEVADDAKGSTLADDADYQKWTSAAGDPGVVSAYASPKAGDYLAQAADFFSPTASCVSSSSSSSDPYGTDSGDTYTSSCSEDDSSAGAATEQMKAFFAGFDGAAMTVRFDGGALEVETAGTFGPTAQFDKINGTDRGADVLETLPSDTAAAYGVGFDPGWFTQVTDYISTVSGGQMDLSSMLDQAEQSTGLTFPDDIETLMGSSAAVGLGSDFDASQVAQQGPASLPLVLKVKGDPSAIGGVLEKLKSGPQGSEAADFLGQSTDGDYSAIGPNASYRDTAVKDGGLGDTDVYKNVVKHSDDAGAVFFVNFDANDWLSKAVSSGVGGLGGDASEISENIEPLQGLGLSQWQDGGVNHAMLRITTD